MNNEPLESKENIIERITKRLQKAEKEIKSAGKDLEILKLKEEGKPKQYEKHCNKCNGTGVTGIETKKEHCFKCSGFGYIENGFNVFSCRICNGDGQLIENEEISCKSCNGKGIIKVVN